MKNKKKITELEERISQLEREMNELKQIFDYKYLPGPYITKIVPCGTPTTVQPPVITCSAEAKNNGNT